MSESNPKPSESSKPIPSSSPPAGLASSSNESSPRPEDNGRLKRKSARMASLKTQQMYGRLQSSPVLKETATPIKPSTATDTGIDPNDINSSPVIKRNSSINEFVEPELAPPKPSYSGLPLESFPSAKIKKESLWPSRKKQKTNTREPSVSIQDTEVDPGVEMTYKNRLQTTASDVLTEESIIRSIVKPLKKFKSDMNDDQQIVNTPTSRNNGRKSTDTSPVRSSKRIKVISPKKSITTASLAPTSGTSNRNGGDVQEESANDDFCSACGGSGVFICCETCPKSFHFLCSDPPLDDLPEDNWQCRECETKQNPKLIKPWNNIGMFGKLLNKTELINPVEFQLPKKLKDHTFVNVSTAEGGVYEDSTSKPELSYTKLNGSQIIGYNYNRDLEIDSLYGKDNKPYLCHRCKMSGLNNRVIVHCDYCSLVWHIDCLREPFYTPKTIGTRWKCPNHIENLLPLNLFNKRNLKDTSIIDVSLHSHFLKLASMNNILIKYRDQPFLKDDMGNGKFPTFQDYLQFEQENFTKRDSAYDDDIFKNKTPGYENSDDIHEDFKIPEFFQNYSIPNNIIAKPGSNLSKIISMTSESDNKVTSFIYRVPEELILLDFLSKSRISKLGSESRSKSRSRKSSIPINIKLDILQDIGEYDNRSNQETELLHTIEEFQNLNRETPKMKQSLKELNFEDLVKVALQLNPLQLNPQDESTSQQISKETQPPQDLTSEEIKELLSVKKLMEIKGKESLLKYLHSQ